MTDPVRGTFHDPGTPLSDRVTDLLVDGFDLGVARMPKKIVTSKRHTAIPAVEPVRLAYVTRILSGIALLLSCITEYAYIVRQRRRFQ